MSVISNQRPDRKFRDGIAWRGGYLGYPTQASRNFSACGGINGDTRPWECGLTIAVSGIGRAMAS
jgi:hypothetical protein